MDLCKVSLVLLQVSEIRTWAEGICPGSTSGSKRWIETLLHPNRNAAWEIPAWRSIRIQFMVTIKSPVHKDQRTFRKGKAKENVLYVVPEDFIWAA